MGFKPLDRRPGWRHLVMFGEGLLERRWEMEFIELVMRISTRTR